MDFKLLTGGLGYVWKTSTGRDIPIKNMTTTHIKNCIDCLEDRGSMRIPDIYLNKTKREWVIIFNRELINRNF